MSQLEELIRGNEQLMIIIDPSAAEDRVFIVTPSSRTTVPTSEIYALLGDHDEPAWNLLEEFNRVNGLIEKVKGADVSILTARAVWSAMVAVGPIYSSEDDDRIYFMREDIEKIVGNRLWFKVAVNLNDLTVKVYENDDDDAPVIGELKLSAFSDIPNLIIELVYYSSFLVTRISVNNDNIEVTGLKLSYNYIEDLIRSGYYDFWFEG